MKKVDPQPPLFAAFDRIRIVSLATRKDRRAQMEAQLSSASLLGDPRVAFFDALSFDEAGPFRRKGSHGAFKSHLTLLEEAATAGQSILILQDDCDFLFPAIRHYELPDRFDVFYGGFTASDPDNLHESEIIGAHFMGFSARAARAAAEYLAAYLEPDFQPDPKAAAESDFNPAIRPPIDGALVWFRWAHPELQTVFALVSVQRSSRTDIGDQRWFDKVIGVREVAELARQVRRRLQAT